MKIFGARYEKGELHLKCEPPDGLKFVYGFKEGLYEILPQKKEKKHRSLDANSMMWSLCEQIARKIGSTKVEVYRNQIREVGVYTPLPIKDNAVEAFSALWAGHGLGWFVDIVDNSKLRGYKLVFAYAGSSTYDTKQMSRLIDNIVQDAKALEIDVMSERERSLLLDAWAPS